jgi:hypothetical protein
MHTNTLIAIVADAHSRQLRRVAEQHRLAARPRVNRPAS